MESIILTQLTEIELEKTTKKIVQDQEKEDKGKYKHIKKQLDKNGIEYSITEYVCPDGNVGFDIIFYKTIDSKDYVKVIGYGKEAVARTADWREINEIE